MTFRIKCRWPVFVLSALMSLMTACAPVPRGGTPLTSIEESLVPDQTVSKPDAVMTPPPAISAALIPQPQFGGDVVAEAERFDIAASNVAAREFFMGLVAGSPMNMVVHPDVTGNISIDLKNTTIEEVLQVVHNVYGYPYSQTGSIYQVMPAGLQARTFQVNYLNLVRKGASQTRVSSGQISQVNGNDSDTDSSSSQQQDVASGSQIDTESVADFWSELKGAVESLVGTVDGRKVVVQPQASVVVVVAMPDEMRLVEEYLQTIQGNIQRQVLIEAKVVEVTLSDGFQSGINWSALGKTSSGKGVLAGQSGGGTIFSSGTTASSITTTDLNAVASAGLDSVVDTSSFGGVFGLALNFNDFQAFVEMLESQGDVQVLSSPRISTVNNQKAVIKVGSDEFFVTDISSDTSSGTTTTTSSDITLTPFFSGIALDVTPQIDNNNQITLHVHPTVSEVVDQTKEINVFGEAQTIPLAYSTVRESDSIVHAQSGQLVVIGGLMQENSTQEKAGIPVLGKLPGIGALFRHNQTSSRKSELVILLKPHVISQQSDWQRQINSTRQRIQQMSPELQQQWRKF